MNAKTTRAKQSASKAPRRSAVRPKPRQWDKLEQLAQDMAGLEIRLPPAIAGVSLPPAVNEELKQIADEIFWELAKDPTFGELTWEGALLRWSNKAHLFFGFKIAVHRYANDLRQNPEAMKILKNRRDALDKGRETQRKKKQELAARAREMLAAGADVPAIAEAINRSTSTVYKLLKRTSNL